MIHLGESTQKFMYNEFKNLNYVLNYMVLTSTSY